MHDERTVRAAACACDRRWRSAGRQLSYVAIVATIRPVARHSITYLDPVGGKAMACAVVGPRQMLCMATCAAGLAYAQKLDSSATHQTDVHGNREQRIREAATGLFSTLDLNNNGMVNKIELLQREGETLSDMRALGVTLENGEQLLQSCDVDGNRAISEHELWAYLHNARDHTGTGVATSLPQDSSEYAQPGPVWDENGYVIGCLCQGRFGNQFDYMLGFIEHAKRLNRTAILPPWVEYNAQKETKQYPFFPAFSQVFKVDAIQQYHHAIDADEFMVHFGRKWRQLGMVGYSALGAAKDFEQGVPRAGFWKRLGVKFTRFEQLTPGARSGKVDDVVHPILAMDCVSGKYPAPTSLNKVVPYFEWSTEIEVAATQLIEQYIGHRDHPFIAVQWRQEFASRARRSGSCGGFSAAQCAQYLDHEASRTAFAEKLGTGSRKHYPSELCAPTLDSMRSLLQAALEAAGPNTKLFVASDTSLRELGELGELFGEFGAVTLAGGKCQRRATSQR